MHDASNCKICGANSANGSMSDEAFAKFVAQCRSELAEKQPLFQKRIEGAAKWFYSLDDGTLTIGEDIFSISAIGTHSAERQTWLWAWANEDFPTAARSQAERIQGLYNVTGFRVFADPGIQASSSDAEVFAAVAIHQLDAIGLFRSASEGPTLYLAVLGSA